MLVKVGEMMNIWWEVFLSWSGSFSWEGVTKWYWLSSITESWLYWHFKWTLKSASWWAWQSGSSWSVYLNSTTSQSASTSWTFFEYDWPLDTWKKFYISWYTGNSRTCTYTDIEFYTYKSLAYKTSQVSWKWKEIKEIWELGFFTLLWASDWKWVTNIISSEESMSATAWAITPWNYVKYITIKWSDWKDYKVGVYNV